MKKVDAQKTDPKKTLELRYFHFKKRQTGVLGLIYMFTPKKIGGCADRTLTEGLNSLSVFDFWVYEFQFIFGLTRFQKQVIDQSQGGSG